MDVIQQAKPRNYHLNIGQEKGLCKCRKSVYSMKPKIINKGVQVNAQKKKKKLM